MSSPSQPTHLAEFHSVIITTQLVEFLVSSNSVSSPVHHWAVNSPEDLQVYHPPLCLMEMMFGGTVKTQLSYDRDLLIRQNTTVVWSWFIDPSKHNCRMIVIYWSVKTQLPYDRDLSDWPSHRSKYPVRNSAELTSFRFPSQFLSST
jgi:hypothetical protein